MNDNDGRPHNLSRKDYQIGVSGLDWETFEVEVQSFGRQSISAVKSLVSSTC